MISVIAAVRSGVRRRLSRRLARDELVDRSLRHSIRDGVAFSFMTGAGETYFSAFALFLKASNAQIGILASLPPLLASFVQLFSAWLGRRVKRRKDIILAGATFQAFAIFPLTFLPLLASENIAVPMLIGCVVLYYAGVNLSTPQWSSLMGELVPERRRGRFFGLRTRLATMTSFIGLVVGGSVLHLFDQQQMTALGYVAIFMMAAVARFVSIHHLRQMYDPPGHVAALELPRQGSWWQQLVREPFFRFSVFFALMQFAVALASPFFAVYLLRGLKFSYLEFTATTAASVLVQFFALTRWGRMGDLFGNRYILRLTGILIPTLPLWWLVSDNLWYLILVQALSGLAWAGFSLSAGNFLYDLIPPARRVTSLAVHNVLAGIGLFAGAVTGGLLIEALPKEINLLGHHFEWASPLYSLFLVSAVARLVVAGAFLPRLKEVRAVRRLPANGLIYRAVRLPTGLFLDIMGAFKRNGK